jgi:hypothetical protein
VNTEYKKIQASVKLYISYIKKFAINGVIGPFVIINMHNANNMIKITYINKPNNARSIL